MPSLLWLPFLSLSRSQAAEFENEAVCRSFLWLSDLFNGAACSPCAAACIIFIFSSSSPWRRQRQIGAVTRSHPTPLPRHHGRGARRCQVLPAPRRDPLGVYQASVRSFLCASMRAPQPATLPLIFGGTPERVVGMRLWLLLWRLGLAHDLGLTCVALLVCGWSCFGLFSCTYLSGTSRDAIV